MRLNQGQNDEQVESLKNFAEWVLQIGNGQVVPPQDELVLYEEDHIVIPREFCDPELKNSVENMIQWTYPDLLLNYKSPKYLSERSILTPTNQIVSHLNSLIVEMIPCSEFTYYSVDKAEDFGGTVLVGETYEMRNFLVTPFTGKYKCFEAHIRIVITQLTRVTAVPPFERVLQDEVFQFTHFYGLTENYIQDSHCIDVVGILHRRKRLRSLINSRNKEQTYLDLVLSDTVSWSSQAIARVLLVPEEHTYTTPSTVKEVPAMFVATINLLQFGGGGLNARICREEKNIRKQEKSNARVNRNNVVSDDDDELMNAIDQYEI
ncbi:hypothetical protein POM88_031145 [Heracleum sosnowskyi]|uniref:ATP-dependent DNA helicase n=1 Tax=Heracleum sosnowskyi TaxID=360622 RepID=A0AAD8HYS4_9APIA|nr:hypothetical protein POM88_031145 [Heracleum sosnowskyi]